MTIRSSQAFFFASSRLSSGRDLRLRKALARHESSLPFFTYKRVDYSGEDAVTCSTEPSSMVEFGVHCFADVNLPTSPWGCNFI